MMILKAGISFGPLSVVMENLEQFVSHQSRKMTKMPFHRAKYHIAVTSRDRWTCRFIQPALGLSLGPLVYEYEDDYVDARLYVLDPRESGSRPTLANFHHRGRGEFYA